jgi:hypothetical protein
MNLGISRDTAFMPSQHIRRDIQHIFLLQTSAHAALAFAPPNVAQRKRKTHSFRRSLGIAQHSPTQRADSNTHDSVFVLRPLADAIPPGATSVPLGRRRPHRYGPSRSLARRSLNRISFLKEKKSSLSFPVPEPGSACALCDAETVAHSTHVCQIVSVRAKGKVGRNARSVCERRTIGQRDVALCDDAFYY